MKIKEELKKLKSMELPKLEVELKETQRKFIDYSLKTQAGKMENYSLINKTRKMIARIKSIISEKNLES